jgi:hypothetical protein
MRMVHMLATPDGRIALTVGDTDTVLGWPYTELLGKQLIDTIVPERFREQHLAAVARHSSTGESLGIIGMRRELTVRAEDGSEHQVWVTIAGLDDYTGCYFALVERP